MMTKDGWVLEVLTQRYPDALDIREIAEGAGKSLPTARRAVRELIDAGHVIPTAPQTSRNRKYLLASGA